MKVLNLFYQIFDLLKFLLWTFLNFRFFKPFMIFTESIFISKKFPFSSFQLFLSLLYLFHSRLHKHDIITAFTVASYRQNRNLMKLALTRRSHYTENVMSHAFFLCRSVWQLCCARFYCQNESNTAEMTLNIWRILFLLFEFFFILLIFKAWCFFLLMGEVEMDDFKGWNVDFLNMKN